ncbi:MAG TPA: multiprotein bridging factor aMBF1 [Candidatus Woesearchaeota archaeon]|nr:multiprotein bridging factor aMBF1 [Candidatus Woesearchaeota archaeon]
MICELCGKNVEELYKTVVEGSTLSLCKECSSFGKVIAKETNTPKEHLRPQIEKSTITQKRTVEETNEFIVKNYSKLISLARQRLGIKQEDAAKKLSEKVSILHTLETGKREPSIPLARKLENFYGIKLVEISKEEKIENTKSKSEGITLGDIITIKKRK